MPNYKVSKNVYFETICSIYHYFSNEAYRNNKYDSILYTYPKVGYNNNF